MNERRALEGKPPLSPKSIQDSRLEKYFLSLDSAVVDTQVLVKQISSIASLSQEEFDRLSSSTESAMLKDILSGHTYDNFAATLGAVVPFLLTCTPDYAVESSPEALLHHQRKIVAALSTLEKQNPYVFQKIYQLLSANFRAGVLWESVSHNRESDAYYKNLLVDYIRRSGRFKPHEEDRASRLLSSVKRGTKFPSLGAFRKKFGIGGP